MHVRANCFRKKKKRDHTRQTFDFKTGRRVRKLSSRENKRDEKKNERSNHPITGAAPFSFIIC